MYSFDGEAVTTELAPFGFEFEVYEYYHIVNSIFATYLADRPAAYWSYWTKPVY